MQTSPCRYLTLMLAISLLGWVAADAQPLDDGISTTQTYNDCDLSVFTPDEPRVNIRSDQWTNGSGDPGVEMLIYSSNQDITLDIPDSDDVNNDEYLLDADTNYRITIDGDGYKTGVTLTLRLYEVPSLGPEILRLTKDVDWFGGAKGGSTAVRVSLAAITEQEFHLFTEYRGRTVPFRFIATASNKLPDNTWSIAKQTAADDVRIQHRVSGNELHLEVIRNSQKFYIGHPTMNSAGGRRKLVKSSSVGHMIKISDLQNEPQARMYEQTSPIGEIFPVAGDTYDGNGDDLVLRYYGAYDAGENTPIVSVRPYRSGLDGSNGAFYALVIQWRGRTIVFDISNMG